MQEQPTTTSPLPPLHKQSSAISHSPNDDTFIINKSHDPRFFYLEPGLGVILLGMVMEPTAWKRLAFWAIFTSGGTALISRREKWAKYASFISVTLAFLFAPGSHRLVKFTFKMATLMRLLRVIEALFEPEYFEERGAKFAVKFAFLYHDLRRASQFENEEEFIIARKQAIQDTLWASTGFLTSIGILHFFQKEIQNSSIIIKTFISVLRFYCATTMVEAAYRTHLVLFRIKPPVCFDSPWKSQTMNEFWSLRWNQAIARQMRNVTYKPLALRGFNKRIAEFGVFSGSAVLHVLPIYLLDGSEIAQASTLLYFCLQPVVMGVERAAGVKGVWWVQLVGWGLAPLFALPLLEVL